MRFMSWQHIEIQIWYQSNVSMNRTPKWEDESWSSSTRLLGILQWIFMCAWWNLEISMCLTFCTCVCVDLDSLLCCIGYWSKFFSKRRTVQNHCLLVMWAWWKKRTWEPTCSVRSFTNFSQNRSLQYIIGSVFLNSTCHCLSKTKFINNFFFKRDRSEVLSSVYLLFAMIKTMQSSTISMSTEMGKNWSGTYWLAFKIQAHTCGSLPLNSWRKLADSMCFITYPTEYLRDCWWYLSFLLQHSCN